MSFNRLLRQQCAVLRQSATPAPDDWGGQGANVWLAVMDGIPCRRYGIDGTEIVRPDGTREIVTTHIDLPTGTDVTPKDRIAVDGQTFDVVSVVPIAISHHLTARAREVS